MVSGLVGSPAAAALSRSLLFSGETIEVVGRFSLAGGDPDAAAPSAARAASACSSACPAAPCST
ncbi:hypothetical protein ACS0ZG_00540 [Burkholderia gladioli]|uniref:hypothetical protein n=1 Tax=Burkholderia gladioli TaxID=28095 RepID=UPI001FC84761|nr:hypothetical protein [Burkholderia gladioli]